MKPSSSNLWGQASSVSFSVPTSVFRRTSLERLPCHFVVYVHGMSPTSHPDPSRRSRSTRAPVRSSSLNVAPRASRLLATVRDAKFTGSSNCAFRMRRSRSIDVDSITRRFLKMEPLMSTLPLIAASLKNTWANWAFPGPFSPIIRAPSIAAESRLSVPVKVEPLISRVSPIFTLCNNADVNFAFHILRRPCIDAKYILRSPSNLEPSK